jgi:hypothetical protein
MRKPAYLPSDKLCPCGCGYPVISIPGKTPKVYASRSCPKRMHDRRKREEARAMREAEAKQAELIPAKSPAVCTCGDYRKCIPCRNTEKRRAFKAGEIPAYRLAVLAQILGG